MNFSTFVSKCHHVYIWLLVIFCLDIGKIVGTTVVQIRNEVLGFVRVLVDQVKSTPLVSNLKEYYKQVSKQFILIVWK